VSPKIVETFGAGLNAASLSVAGLTSGGAPASSVSFNGFGQPTSATSLAIIDVTHAQPGTRRLRVAVSPAGSVRMCDQDVTTGPTACLP
jgi:type IV fimbrial biogenesis protein FimT